MKMYQPNINYKKTIYYIQYRIINSSMSYVDYYPYRQDVIFCLHYLNHNWLGVRTL